MRTLRSYSFYDCGALRRVFLPKGLTSLGLGTFQNCAALERVFLPDGITGIGYKVFAGCARLSRIGIPSSIRFIHQNAFSDGACSAAKDSTLHIYYGDSESWWSYWNRQQSENTYLAEQATSLPINAGAARKVFHYESRPPVSAAVSEEDPTAAELWLPANLPLENALLLAESLDENGRAAQIAEGGLERDNAVFSGFHPKRPGRLFFLDPETLIPLTEAAGLE